jgi:hypothetical protein
MSFSLLSISISDSLSKGSSLDELSNNLFLNNLFFLVLLFAAVFTGGEL